MRWSEIVNESTCASNVATVVGNNGSAGSGSIGAGFDPDGDWGVYNNAKPKNQKRKGNGVLKR